MIVPKNVHCCCIFILCCIIYFNGNIKICQENNLNYRERRDTSAQVTRAPALSKEGKGKKVLQNNI